MTFSWKERKYFDNWSIVHLAAGLIAGSLPVLYQSFKFWPTFVGFLVIAFIWEIFEYYREIFEYLSNKISDLLVAIIGFYFAYYFGITLSKEVAMLFLYIYLTIYLLLNLIGFLAYEKRKFKKPTNDVTPVGIEPTSRD